MQLDIFPFAFAAAATITTTTSCSFAGSSWLGSCWARELAEPRQAARGFYSPLRRRHREGAGPGLLIRQSPCAAPQLHQLLATASLPASQPPRLLQLPAVGVCKPSAPHTPPGGARCHRSNCAGGGGGRGCGGSVCRWNLRGKGRICERAIMTDTQLPGRVARSAAAALQRRLPVAAGVGQVRGPPARAQLPAALQLSHQPECTAPWLWRLGRSQRGGCLAPGSRKITFLRSSLENTSKTRSSLPPAGRFSREAETGSKLWGHPPQPPRQRGPSLAPRKTPAGPAS